MTAAALVVLVQTGAISAPMMHVHLDAGDSGHHHGQAIHAHLAAHEMPVGDHGDTGPFVDHQETAGRTASAQIFVGGAMAPFSLPAVPAAGFTLLVPPPHASGRTPHITHAHDPPSLRVRSPRAPPLSLS